MNDARAQALACRALDTGEKQKSRVCSGETYTESTRRVVMIVRAPRAVHSIGLLIGNNISSLLNQPPFQHLQNGYGQYTTRIHVVWWWCTCTARQHTDALMCRSARTRSARAPHGTYCVCVDCACIVCACVHAIYCYCVCVCTITLAIGAMISAPMGWGPKFACEVSSRRTRSASPTQSLTGSIILRNGYMFWISSMCAQRSQHL